MSVLSENLQEGQPPPPSTPAKQSPAATGSTEVAVQKPQGQQGKLCSSYCSTMISFQRTVYHSIINWVFSSHANNWNAVCPYIKFFHEDCHRETFDQLKRLKEDTLQSSEKYSLIAEGQLAPQDHVDPCYMVLHVISRWYSAVGWSFCLITIHKGRTIKPAAVITSSIWNSSFSLVCSSSFSNRWHCCGRDCSCC